jgi:hypothetical protein
MSPKLKAKELIQKYFDLAESIEWTKNENVIKECQEFNTKENVEVKFYWKQLAKKSALLAVDEIVLVIDAETQTKTWLFWKSVKHEIENL